MKSSVCLLSVSTVRSYSKTFSFSLSPYQQFSSLPTRGLASFQSGSDCMTCVPLTCAALLKIPNLICSYSITSPQIFFLLRSRAIKLNVLMKITTTSLYYWEVAASGRDKANCLMMMRCFVLFFLFSGVRTLLFYSESTRVCHLPNSIAARRMLPSPLTDLQQFGGGGTGERCGGGEAVDRIAAAQLGEK